MDRSDVMIALGAVAAGATAGHPSFAVDLHEDGHWVQLVAFPTRRDAKDGVARAVAAGASPAHLRVRKLHVDAGA